MRPSLLHITPHAGGGVGTVLRGLLPAQARGSFEVRLLALEDLNEATRATLSSAGIPWVDRVGTDVARVAEACAEVDLVLVHWWNHPLLSLVLASGLPPVRLALWSHVNGLADPQAFTPALLGAPARLLFTSAASLASPLLSPALAVSPNVVPSCGPLPADLPVRIEKKGPFEVGYLGTLDPAKIHPDFLRMAAACWSGRPVVVAGGPSAMADALRSEVARRGVAARFEILGPLVDPFPLLDRLHVLLYPLAPTHYGTAEQVLIEAMLFGVVPVVWDNPPERAIVRHGETGFVCGSIDEMAAAVHRLREDPRLHRTLAHAGRRWALENRGLDNMVTRLSTILLDSLGVEKRSVRVASTVWLEGGSDADRLCLASYEPASRRRLLSFDRGSLPEGFWSETRGSPAHYHRHLGLVHPSLRAAATLSGAVDAVERPCPLCGGRRGRILSDLTWALFDDTPIPAQKQLTWCRCGMLYDNTLLSEADLVAYYGANAHYASAVTGGVGGSSRGEIARYQRIMGTLVPNLVSGPVLDFGCGRGGLLRELQARGLQAVGVEPGSGAPVAKQAENLPIFSSIGDVPEGPFGGVILSHVLEHLLAPADLLKQVLSRAADGAAVYLEVPDSEAVFSSEPRYDEYYFEHINHFTEASLQALAACCGVEVVEVERRPFSFDRPDALCLVLRGRKGRKQEAPPSTDVFATLPPPGEALAGVPDGPVLLRGIPQYGQLLLGSCPYLADRVCRIVDSSPGKVGRTIRGLVVERPSDMGDLPVDLRLLVPKSQAAPTILRELELGFPGHFIREV